MNKSVRFPPLGQLSPRSRWTYALTIPCFSILFSYLLVGDNYWQNGWLFTGATLLNGLLLTGIFFSQTGVAERITQRYPRFGQTPSRVVLTLLAHTLLSTFFLTSIAALYGHFQLFGSSLTYAILWNVYCINLLFIVLSVGINEAFYTLNQWQQSQINKEKLKKENLRGQLQGLKSQVNPHFLFNSLNSLSSLIADEPQRAEQFVDQMARVYRYMLQSNRDADVLPTKTHPATDDSSDELTTLDAELAFIDSYYHLLKTRHGTGLHLEVRVDNRYRLYRLPPLTLQLLVENAVKHNVILASRPLFIDIETTGQGFLRVRNNLQKKLVRPVLTQLDKSESGESEPTPVGLANIQTRYHLLAQTEPHIEAGPDYFTVTLPLLAKAATNP